MTRVEIESELIDEIYHLPVEKIKLMLDLALSWKEEPIKKTKKRPLGLLKDYKCVIKEDFKMTDEEFLQS
ncbi:MAG: hypothetical protein RL637_413 [Pseudomonadota bacterium]|jgi:hypothetical protein